MLPFFLHGAYFLEMLAVFQLNGILLCVVVTFLSSLMWEEEAIDYMRWGFTLTHTHTHTRGDRASGLWLQRPAPVKRSVCGSRSNSGAFLLRSLCVSSKESKFTERQRGWKKEGKWGRTVLFSAFLLNTPFFFWLQRQLAGTWTAIMIHIQAILKKACLFCHAHSVGIKMMMQAELQQSWTSVETWFDRTAGHCRFLCVRVSIPHQFILGEEDEFIWTLFLFFLGIWIICALNSSNQLLWSSLPAI